MFMHECQISWSIQLIKTTPIKFIIWLHSILLFLQSVHWRKNTRRWNQKVPVSQMETHLAAFRTRWAALMMDSLWEVEIGLWRRFVSWTGNVIEGNTVRHNGQADRVSCAFSRQIMWKVCYKNVINQSKELEWFHLLKKSNVYCQLFPNTFQTIDYWWCWRYYVPQLSYVPWYFLQKTWCPLVLSAELMNKLWFMWNYCFLYYMQLKLEFPTVRPKDFWQTRVLSYVSRKLTLTPNHAWDDLIFET